MTKRLHNGVGNLNSLPILIGCGLGQFVERSLHHFCDTFRNLGHSCLGHWVLYDTSMNDSFLGSNYHLVMHMSSLCPEYQGLTPNRRVDKVLLS